MSDNLPLPATTVKFLAHSGEARPLWEEHQMRAYGDARAAAAVERERERIEGEALHRMKYHNWPAGDDPKTDPADWELFEPNISCDECVEVLIIPASAIRKGTP